MATIVTPSAHFTYGYNTGATTYDGANEALDVSGVLDTLKATDVPLLALIGRDSLRDPCTQVKHEWLEDEIRGLKSTTTDADLDDAVADNTTITLGTAGDYLKFRGAAVGTGPCDIVRLSSTVGYEIAPVIAVADNTIQVTRGYFAGSSPVDHTAASVVNIEIIGTFQPQGKATVGAQRTTIKDPKFNYTQIFEDSYAANETQRATKKFIRHDESSYQMGLIAENFGRLFNRSLIYGERIAPAAANGGTFQGIVGTLSTNVFDKAQALLTETMLFDALAAMWDVGAGGDDGIYAFVNYQQQRRMGQLLDPYRQANYSDRVFGTWVDAYRTPVGNLKVVLERAMDPGDVLVVDGSRVGFGPMVGRALGMLAIPRTSREVQQWQWTGEYTAEVRQEKSHALITDLASTGF